MIKSLYQFVNKGSFRTLSFILAIALTLAFFLNINDFATALRTSSPIWIIIILWGIVTIWIHGIGFDIKNSFWQVIFSPWIGYISGISAIVQHFFFMV